MYFVCFDIGLVFVCDIGMIREDKLVFDKFY